MNKNKNENQASQSLIHRHENTLHYIELEYKNIVLKA